MQREFIKAVFYLVVDQNAVIFCFFMLHSKNILCYKSISFKFKTSYVLKTHCDCFNSRVNNLDYMEREQFFIDIKKLRVW